MSQEKILIEQGTDALSRGVMMHPLRGKDGISPIAPLIQPDIPSRELLEACHASSQLCIFLAASTQWLFFTYHGPWVCTDMLHASIFDAYLPSSPSNYSVVPYNLGVKVPGTLSTSCWCRVLFCGLIVGSQSFSNMKANLGSSLLDSHSLFLM